MQFISVILTNLKKNLCPEKDIVTVVNYHRWFKFWLEGESALPILQPRQHSLLNIHPFRYTLKQQFQSLMVLLIVKHV